jgi:predicted RNA-binding Zn ribbon-like protein
MLFADDTELALASAAALINTAEPEILVDPGALDEFVSSWGWSGSRTHDEAELRAVRALRPRLREVWTCDEPRAVEVVNELLREANALPQLVTHDGLPYHLHASEPDAPLAERMSVDAAMALLDLIRTGERHRLHVCAAEDCDHVLVDLSRNRSRRFCDAGCGNRLAVAAYRARRAGVGRDTTPGPESATALPGQDPAEGTQERTSDV